VTDAKDIEELSRSIEKKLYDEITVLLRRHVDEGKNPRDFAIALCFRAVAIAAEQEYPEEAFAFLIQHMTTTFLAISAKFKTAEGLQAIREAFQG
jgi:hypothetical protein